MVKNIKLLLYSVVTFIKEVMFSPVSVCLLTGLLRNYYQFLLKFYGMVVHNPRTS